MMRSEEQIGRLRPKITDVARAIGMSSATVSNALNNRRYVDAETREKVLAAALRLGYTPNARARALRTGRADTIAILSSMPFAIAGGRARLGFLMEVAGAAATAALQSGIALILVPPLEKTRPPLQHLHFDGALVIEPLSEDPEVALLSSRGVPVVTIGRQLGVPNIPFVDLHSGDGTRLILDHLRAAGASTIGLVIGAQARYSYAQTERAYRTFVTAHKKPAIIARADEMHGERAGREAMLELLRTHPEMDALFVSVDVFAVGAVAAAAELGRSIPRDLKLATRYDGAPARECIPPLTALNLHLDEGAVLGVQLLLDRIQGKRTKKSVRAAAPTLIARASSGPTQA